MRNPGATAGRCSGFGSALSFALRGVTKEGGYEEDPRYTKKRSIRYGRQVYDTTYTQKLIEAYRIIRKNMDMCRPKRRQ